MRDELRLRAYPQVCLRVMRRRGGRMGQTAGHAGFGEV
jgi:hypothetical protein